MPCPIYASSFTREISKFFISAKIDHSILCKSGISLNHRCHTSAQHFSHSATQCYRTQNEGIRKKYDADVPLRRKIDDKQSVRVTSQNRRKRSEVAYRQLSSTLEDLDSLNAKESIRKSFDSPAQSNETQHQSKEPLCLDIPITISLDGGRPFLDKLRQEQKNDIIQDSRISSRFEKLSQGIDKNSSTSRRPGKSATSFTDETRGPITPREPWQTQKESLLKKFGSSGWLPRKRLSPDALDGIRALHSQYPEKFTTPVLAEHFKVSPDAVRRIIKSKWRANEEEEEARRKRWDRRGEAIWTQMVEMGIKPPKKWRVMGVGKGMHKGLGKYNTSLGTMSENHRLSELKYKFGDMSNSPKVLEIPQNEHIAFQEISLSDRML